MLDKDLQMHVRDGTMSPSLSEKWQTEKDINNEMHNLINQLLKHCRKIKKK